MFVCKALDSDPINSRRSLSQSPNYTSKHTNKKQIILGVRRVMYTVHTSSKKTHIQNSYKVIQSGKFLSDSHACMLYNVAGNLKPRWRCRISFGFGTISNRNVKALFFFVIILTHLSGYRCTVLTFLHVLPTYPTYSTTYQPSTGNEHSDSGSDGPQTPHTRLWVGGTRHGGVQTWERPGLGAVVHQCPGGSKVSPSPLCYIQPATQCHLAFDTTMIDVLSVF